LVLLKFDDKSSKTTESLGRSAQKSSRLNDLLAGGTSSPNRPGKSGEINPRPSSSFYSNAKPKYKTIDAITHQENQHAKVTASGSQDYGTINDFREKYLRDRQTGDQNYLVESIIPSDIRNFSPFSLAFIIFQSLLYWKVFDEADSAFLTKLFEGCKHAIKAVEESQKCLFLWVENITCLMSLIHSEESEDFDTPTVQGALQELSSLMDYAFSKILLANGGQLGLLSKFTNALNSANTGELTDAIIALLEKKYQVWSSPQLLLGTDYIFGPVSFALYPRLF